MSMRSGPLMAHNPQMQRPQTGPSLMALNKVKTLNVGFQNDHIIYKNMPVQRSTKMHNEDYGVRCRASSFARAGVSYQGKHYMRDPVTGTWFKNEAEKQRVLHHSNSDLAFRYTESKNEKGNQGRTYAIWAAPCPPGSFWKEPIAQPQTENQFGFIDGPVQGHAPIDPRDTKDPTGPLTRTASAPNFSPSAAMRAKMSKTMSSFGGSTTLGSPGSTMNRSGLSALSSTK